MLLDKYVLTKAFEKLLSFHHPSGLLPITFIPSISQRILAFRLLIVEWTAAGSLALRQSSLGRQPALNRTGRRACRLPGPAGCQS